MRIVLVSHEYPPFRGGGIGTYANVMSRCLAEAGHEVHVLTNRFDYGSRDPQHSLAHHQDGNLHVHRIDAITDAWEPRRPHDHLGDLLGRMHHDVSPYLYYAEHVSRALESICRDFPPDVIEFPECAAEGYLALRRKRLGLALTDVPMTVTLHSPIHEIYHYNLYSKHNLGFQRRTMMEEFSIRHADRVNSPSRLLAEIVYARLGLPADSPACDIVPLPMDFASLPVVTADAIAAARTDAPTLLFVGRLEPRKGVRDLVDAAVRLMPDFPGLRVQLVGKDCDAGEVAGSMTAYLRSRIPRPWQERFEFAGLIPREQLFARYATATACVFAAPWDNFPLTCVEAMASRALVIASDYTGMAEMIEDGQSGLLFKAGDVGALTATIRRVLESPDRFAPLREAAATRIREVCDPQAAVRNRVAHYEQTIADHRRRSSQRIVAPKPPRALRIAAFVPVAPDQSSAATRTVESLRMSAQRAGVALEVSLGLLDPATNHLPTSGDVRMISAERGDERTARAAWLERCAAEPPDHLLTAWPGETFEPEFLPAGLAALAAHPQAAWLGVWSLPTDGASVGPLTPFDFSLPLELLDWHPAAHMLIRYAAFLDVGGWNLALPPGWCEWDFCLACEAAGHAGLVLPAWLSHFVPRPELGLEPPAYRDALPLWMEQIVARNRMLFDRHGALLWLFRAQNSITTMPPPPRREPEPISLWQQWWGVTKACLKHQYPRLARAYQHFFRRREH